MENQFLRPVRPLTYSPGFHACSQRCRSLFPPLSRDEIARLLASSHLHARRVHPRRRQRTSSFDDVDDDDVTSILLLRVTAVF